MPMEKVDTAEAGTAGRPNMSNTRPTTRPLSGLKYKSRTLGGAGGQGNEAQSRGTVTMSDCEERGSSKELQ